MAKVIVITSPALAAGFALAGVDAYVADSATEAKKLLADLMHEPEVGIIAMDTGYLSELDEGTRRRASESVAPVVVALPTGVPTTAGIPAREQIAEMMRRAIGFRISFKER